MENDSKKSILHMAKGAIEERVDYEVSRVVDNILDMNTDPRKKRKIVLTIEMIPDEDRTIIQTNVTAKSTLAPTKPVTTALAIAAGEGGQIVIAEMTAQIPGQYDVDGGIEPEPKILKLAQL